MKTVLLTGASSGIGLATAEYLVEKGFKVFGTTRSIASRKAQIDALAQKHGDQLQWVEMDVTQDASVEKAVQTVLKKAGVIDVLICNAGFGIYGSIEEMPMALAIKQFDTNVFGYLRTLKAVLPIMRNQKSGQIVLISSMAGILAIPFQSHYSASKYAIEAITEGLRQELRGMPITVAAVRPGDIATEFNNETTMHTPDNSPYKEYCQKCWKTIDKNMQVAPKPILVAKVIHKILKTRHPKATYSAADFITSLSPILLPLMPSKMKEAAVRMFYNL